MSFSTAAGANYWEQAKAATPFVQTGRPFTVMAWVNLSAVTTDWSCICSTYDGTANSWECGARGGVAANGWTGNCPYFTWAAAGTYYGESCSGPSAYASTTLAADVWTHLCWRYGLNGGTQFDEVRNGRIVGTTGTGGVAIAAGVRKLRIHQSSDNAGAGMPGRTACIRMFEGCLSLPEIEENRRSILCPPSLRYKNIFDIPGINRTGFEPPVDKGPKNLGPFIRVGTVTTSFDPPVFVRPVRPVRRRIWDSGTATRTATAAVTIGAATCSGAATFAPGTKTASAAVTVGRATASGTATFVAPVYSGSAAVTVGAATCSGTATFAAGTKTASAAVTVGAATASGAATFTAPVYSATASVTVGAATCSASATHTTPVYTGTAAITMGEPKRIQLQSATAAANTVDVTFPQATRANNTLIAIISSDSGVISGFSAPTNWLQRISSANADQAQACYYYPSAPSQSGALTFGHSTATTIAVTVLEYTGISTPDTSAQAGSGTLNPGTFTAVTTANAKDVLLGTICVDTDQDPITWSAPTDSFAIIAQGNDDGSNLSYAVVEKVVETTGSYGGEITASSTGVGRTFKSLTVAFKGASWITVSGSATHVRPTYTGTAAVTVGAATCAGTALFASGVFSASAAVTVGAATASGTATFTAPVYTGTAAVTIGAATCSAAATFTAGAETVGYSRRRKKKPISARMTPERATGRFWAKSPTVTAGAMTPPAGRATGRLIANRPDVTGGSVMVAAAAIGTLVSASPIPHGNEYGKLWTDSEDKMLGFGLGEEWQ